MMTDTTEKQKPDTASLWPDWLEIPANYIREVQKIVRLLVEFDEKTGRYAQYENAENHYIRKAVAVSHQENVHIYLKDMGGDIFAIVAHLANPSGRVTTAWVHEDGIHAERQEAELDHPVHKIICMTDLY